MKLPPKTKNRFIVSNFLLKSFNRIIPGKWLTDQMWYHYINKNHTLTDYSLVDPLMLHHYMSYYQTLKHVDFEGKVNDEVVYHNVVTCNTASTL